MKKTLLFLLMTAAAAVAQAQQFVIIDSHEGQTVIPAEDIESITYERSEEFYDRLLPAALAADSHTTIFSQALQATGLADSLMAFADFNYVMRERSWQLEKLIFSFVYTPAMNELSIPEARLRQFSAFVETDDVLAAHGINNLGDLKAYASSVYDDVFPEDAGIADPTDRRNALNRFVAYHLLPFGSDDVTLTADTAFFIRERGDVSDWYETLMPGACLKCSRPSGNEAGLYLNRRGVQDRADRYGVKIRGARIVPSATGALTQSASNGAYYYIDDLLTYGRQTQEQVLNERWRVDLVTLSPDFMTHRTRRAHAQSFDVMDPIPFCFNGAIANFELSDDMLGLIAYPIHYSFWSYGGDELVPVSEEIGRSTIKVKLPPLPKGEWELRYGVVPEMPYHNTVFSINGEMLGDTLKTLSANRRSAQSVLDSLGWRKGLPRDEQIAADRQLRQSGWMRGPAEYATCVTGEGSAKMRTDDNSCPMCDIHIVRRILGRIRSDGRTPLWLTIEAIRDKDYYRSIQYDYLEFCPASMAEDDEYFE